MEEANIQQNQIYMYLKTNLSSILLLMLHLM